MFVFIETNLPKISVYLLYHIHNIYQQVLPNISDSIIFFEVPGYPVVPLEKSKTFFGLEIIHASKILSVMIRFVEIADIGLFTVIWTAETIPAALITIYILSNSNTII